MPDGNVVTFLTMELLRGISLDRYMRGRGRLTTAEALPYVLQMTAGLEAAHTAGVIHRDFKPGNLVLVPEAGAGPDDPQRLVSATSAWRAGTGWARRPSPAPANRWGRRSTWRPSRCTPVSSRSRPRPTSTRSAS
jgi:serine/threonine protein kinase